MNVVPIAKDEQSPFDQFWEQYPRKVARKDALKAWSRMADVHQRLALFAVFDHAKLWRIEGREPHRIPHAATWLNGERFLDEVELPKKPGQPSMTGDCGHSVAGGWTIHGGKRICNACWEKR